MKNLVLLLTLAFFFLSPDIKAQWVKIYGSYGDTINCFTVSHTGSGGANLFVGIRSRGIILSSNNGISWVQANSGLTNSKVNTLVTGPNSEGGTNIFAGTGGGVFLSTNEGRNWIQTDLQNINTTSFAVCPNSIDSIDEGNSIVFAGTFNGLFLSTNYGINWTQTGLANINVSSLVVNTGATDTSGAGATVVGSTKIFAGTLGHGIFFSTDYGTNWIQTDSNTWKDSFISTLLLKDSNIFAGTYSRGVLRSTNNGTSWSVTNSGLVYVNVFALTSVDTKIIAGTYGGGVYISTNNGTNWTAVNTGLNDAYVNAFAVIGSNLFAGMESGIWRRPISEMLTGIEDKPKKLPTSFILCQNYPNPFNPSTTIKYAIPKQEHVILKVYDMLGKEVALLVNENKESGEYDINFNASKLASGIYFYRITAGEFTETKKLILLK
jgi:hypothetical protein